MMDVEKIRTYSSGFFAIYFCRWCAYPIEGYIPPEENGKFLQASFARKFCKQALGGQSRIGCGGDKITDPLASPLPTPKIGYSPTFILYIDNQSVLIKM